MLDTQIILIYMKVEFSQNLIYWQFYHRKILYSIALLEL